MQINLVVLLELKVAVLGHSLLVILGHYFVHDLVLYPIVGKLLLHLATELDAHVGKDELRLSIDLRFTLRRDQGGHGVNANAFVGHVVRHEGGVPLVYACVFH